MIISGIDKSNNLKVLKNNTDIKDLEIKNLSLDDDWSLIAKAKNLENFTVKDSYIDYKKFYNAICSLKKLNKLTYNNYCYFNKNKKDKFPKNIKLPSLKIFRLEFPDPEEPDFEINTYWQKSYKNKYNSITDVKDCHKVFNNLEEIEFVNYQTYRRRILEDDENNKKIKSEIYWNMNFNILKNFKNLKKINIDQEKNPNLMSLGIFEIIKKNNLNNLGIQINGQKEFDFKNTIIQSNIINIGKYFFNGKLILENFRDTKKYKKIFNFIDSSSNILSVNPSCLYNINYGYRKKDKWKISKNQNIQDIFNNNVETIIFSDAYSFLNNRAHSESYIEKKSDVFLELFKNLQNLKNIVFSFEESEDRQLDSKKNYFLTLLLYKLINNNKNINIHLLNLDIDKILSNKSSKEDLEEHLIFLISFFIKTKPLINGKFNFFNKKEEELLKIYNNFIYKNINEVMVVDDPIYNYSERFNNIEVIYSDFNHARSFIYELDVFSEQKEILKNISFGECYWETLGNLYSWCDKEVFKNNKKIFLLIKKTYLEDFLLKSNNFINTIYYHYTSPVAHLKNMIEFNVNNKVKKINDLINNNKLDRLEKSAKNSVNEILNSPEFNFNNSKENLFFERLKTPEYFKDENAFSKINNNNLKQLHLQGDSPLYGKYITLNEIPKIFTEKLEHLQIRGLVRRDNLNLPKLLNLKSLELDFSYSIYNSLDKKDNDGAELSNFCNLPNLERLVIHSLRSEYNPNSIKFFGHNNYQSERWNYTVVNFSDIHLLEKLKTIKIRIVDYKDIKKIKFFPSVENLSLHIFQTTTEHGPDEEKYLTQPIEEKGLSFLRNSKRLKSIRLHIGDVPFMEDLWGSFLSTYYIGNGDFINYISHHVEELDLEINIDINKQLVIQDIINNICNRLLNLKKLSLKFGIVIDNKTFDWEKVKYKKKIMEQILDFKKFSRLKNLVEIDMYMWSSSIKFKTINFKELIKLKKLKSLKWNFETISFADFRQARKLFKTEEYEDPKYYDEDYEYMCDEDAEYKKNWNRLRFISTDPYDDEWVSLEDQYIALEKKENEKNYKKPKEIIKKKKIN